MTTHLFCDNGYAVALCFRLPQMPCYERDQTAELSPLSITAQTFGHAAMGRVTASAEVS
jgi:hypothetical protein